MRFKEIIIFVPVLCLRGHCLCVAPPKRLNRESSESLEQSRCCVPIIQLATVRSASLDHWWFCVTGKVTWRDRVGESEDLQYHSMLRGKLQGRASPRGVAWNLFPKEVTYSFKSSGWIGASRADIIV